MPRPRELISSSPEETADIGRRLGERLQGGEVVLLFGALGAGKTQFVRGISAGLGLDATGVRSPSYTLIMEHTGKISLYHVDLFRLAVEDLPDLGLEDLYGPSSVVAVEWAERLEEAGWDLGEAVVVEIDFHPQQRDGRILILNEELLPE